MSKCRVWYWPSDKISVSYPDLRYNKFVERRINYWKSQKPLLRRMASWLKEMPTMTLEEWIDYQLDQVAIKAPQFAGLDFEDMDTSELPQDKTDRNRWRGTKATGVKVDNTVVLRKDLLQQIDSDLAKANPNVIKIERLRRKIEKKEHD